MTCYLTMENISKSFPGVKALQDVSFSADMGEIVALVGENGAGKSTLMKILAGAYTPDEGKILLDGKWVAINTPLDAQALGISIIYQELMLIPQLNAVENVFLGHPITTNSGMLDWVEMRKRAGDILGRLGVEIDLKVPVSQLSVAQRQLIEIAKALSIESRIIIMDEPTASLNTEEIKHLFSIVKELQREKVTVIFITHHLNEIFELCERVVVLRDGEVVGEKKVAETNENDLVRLMIGHSLQEAYQHEKTAAKEIIFEVAELNRENILKDISFKLHRGEILGIAGLMGSGRTEIVRAIFGADRIDSGDISINGKKVRIRSPRDAIKHGLGLAPEDRKNAGLVLILSTLHNISLPFIKRLSSFVGIKLKQERDEVKQLIKELEIKVSSDTQKVMNLSGGNQQKVVLAKLLGADVDIYLLDEPTRGIDVGAKEVIYQIINKLAEKGASVILISSELEEVLRMSDRILVFHLGQITGEFEQSEFDLEQIMLCAMGKQRVLAERGVS